MCVFWMLYLRPGNARTETGLVVMVADGGTWRNNAAVRNTPCFTIFSLSSHVIVRNIILTTGTTYNNNNMYNTVIYNVLKSDGYVLRPAIHLLCDFGQWSRETTAHTTPVNSCQIHTTSRSRWNMFLKCGLFSAISCSDVFGNFLCLYHRFHVVTAA